MEHYLIIDAHAHLWKEQNAVVDGQPISHIVLDIHDDDPNNDKVYIRNNENILNNYETQLTFKMSGRIAASGNINSMINYSALTDCCFMALFMGCQALTASPELPAEELAEGCYYGMFYNCTSLRKAPTLPAAELVNSCYSMMFYGCESLNSVDVNFTSWNSSSTNHWLEGVAENGTFRCTEDLDTFRRGVTYIPSEWNISLKNN